MKTLNKCLLLFLSITWLTLNVTFAKGTFCCKDGSYLTKGGCTDGKNLTITCKIKYLINVNDEDEMEFNVNDNDELKLGDSATIPPDE